MYKLIKHSIEEHHYEHPRLAEIASGFCGNVPPPPPGMSGVTSGSPLMAVNIEPAIKFRFMARHLWGDHIWYARELISALLNGSEEANSTEERLLINAMAIGDAIKPFYGETAGNRLAKLLEAFCITLIDTVKAAKMGNGLSGLLEKADADIVNLADFLDNANPGHWPKSAVTEIFRKYLELTTEEIKAKLTKNWAEDIAYSDKIKTLVMSFADVFAKGLIEQFPQKFFL